MARWFAAAAFAVTAAALSLAPAMSASAHDFLIGSSPAADSVQSTPLREVTLTFNDVVLNIGGSSSIVQVTGASGAHFETGCATTLDRTVSVPVALGRSGAYTVTYQIVSADGHTVSDKFSFDYEPPAGTKAATGSATSRCGRAGAATSTAAPTAPAPTPTPATSTSGDMGLVIGLAAGILGLAVAAVVVIVVTRKKPASPTGESTKSQ
jgi:methionine-rich copper-binding protein CopC